MSSDVAIRARGLSKRYTLGGPRLRYRTLRESLATGLATAVGRRPEAGTGKIHQFWALDEVSVDIAEGQVVGIVGRNGAGKSTLLKVISRITVPTAGWVEVRGRVGSLLEVGTGFHPELTGRENVFLNGAILGMRKAEIRRRFDDIVEFAEIEAFLDTPVKRYSSGMYVRLAFSVAAHLEPEVMLVDEVLAVGDASFQRRCLGRMQQIAGEGRTVVFVSHNLAVVQALCERGLFIEEGRLLDDGPTEHVVESYLRTLESAAAADLLERTDRDRRGWREVMISSVRVEGPTPGSAVATGRLARILVGLTGVQSRLECSLTLSNSLGQPVVTFDSTSHAAQDELVAGAEPMVVCEVPELPLKPGRYRIDVALKGNGHIQDGIEAAALFDVETGLVQGRPVPGDELLGDVFVAHRWRIPA